MNIRGMTRARRLLRRAHSALRRQAAILQYHRVFEPSADPMLLCTNLNNFEQQLQHLRANYTVLSLSDLVNRMQTGELPYRAVVLTFDDGYVDNLWNAKPLLEAYELPATVFVTTGYIDSGREPWWDELERLILYSKSVAKTLRLIIDGLPHEWQVGSSTPCRADTSWNVMYDTDPTPRHKAYRDIHKVLRPLGHETRDDLMSLLRESCSAEEQGRCSYRILSAGEIRELIAGGLVDIGSHTVTHALLVDQPPATQRWEMTESKSRLQAILGRPVRTLGYPFGKVSIEVARVTSEVGFEAACSMHPRAVTHNTPIYQLPRFAVRNWDGAEFATRLSNFFRS